MTEGEGPVELAEGTSTYDLDTDTESEKSGQSEQPQKEEGGGYFSVSYGNGIPLEKERRMMWSVDTSLLPNIRPYVKEA